MLTKEDLAQIKELLKDFATKDDIKNIRSDMTRFATKNDLKNFATKDDLKSFATRDDLKEFKEEIKEELTVVIDQKLQTFSDEIIEYVGIQTESIKRELNYQPILNDHEERITKIEKKLRN